MKKNPKVLFVLWCAAYAVFSTGSSVYTSYQEAVNGIDCTQFGGGFQLFTLCAVLFGFLPALFWINHITKKSNSQNLKMIVSWALTILYIWTAAMILFTLLAWFSPGVLEFIESFNQSLNQS